MVSLRFDCRDLFRSVRLSFSFQRLWIQFVGGLIGYAGYVILAYLGFLVSGADMGQIWERFGLVPLPVGVFLPWYAWILFGIGLAVLLVAWLVSSTAVARAVYMQLKGNTFYTWKEAMRFALKKKAGSLVAAPVAIALIAGLTLLGGGFIGLLGRIPFVGELGISLFGIVWFAASLFVVFVLLALGVSLLITPGVLASTDDDAFEGIFQSFSVLAGQPWRLLLYEAMVLVLSVVGFGILAFFAKRAWDVMSMVFLWGMGDKYETLSFGATALFQNWVFPAVMWIKPLLGKVAPFILFDNVLPGQPVGGWLQICSVILAAMMFLVGAYVVSFPLAIFNAGNGIIFLILKKIKDNENLLERKDKEEEDEEEPKSDNPEEPKAEAPAKPKATRAKAAKPKAPAKRSLKK